MPYYNHSILFVDADAQARAQSVEGFRRMMGSGMRMLEADTVEAANNHIFDLLVEHGTLPSMVVTELYVPTQAGEIIIYANELTKSYPEIPMMLFTSHVGEIGRSPLKSRVKLLACMTKPWHEATHSQLLSLALTTTL